MVWPILISVAVTPRISAAVEAAGEASSASAPSTANFGIERIGTPPHLFLFDAQPGRPPSAKHAGALRGKPNDRDGCSKNAKARRDAGLLHYSDCRINGCRVPPGAGAPARRPDRA